MPVRLASIESRGDDMKFGSGESLIRRDFTGPLGRTAVPKGSVEIVQEEESEDADDGTHAKLPLKRRRMAKITVFNETGNIVGMRIVTGEEEIFRILGEDISSLYS